MVGDPHGVEPEPVRALGGLEDVRGTGSPAVIWQRQAKLDHSPSTHFSGSRAMVQCGPSPHRRPAAAMRVGFRGVGGNPGARASHVHA